MQTVHISYIVIRLQIHIQDFVHFFSHKIKAIVEETISTQDPFCYGVFYNIMYSLSEVYRVVDVQMYMFYVNLTLFYNVLLPGTCFSAVCVHLFLFLPLNLPLVQLYYHICQWHLLSCILFIPYLTIMWLCSAESRTAVFWRHWSAEPIL